MLFSSPIGVWLRVSICPCEPQTIYGGKRIFVSPHAPRHVNGFIKHLTTIALNYFTRGERVSRNWDRRLLTRRLHSFAVSGIASTLRRDPVFV